MIIINLLDVITTKELSEVYGVSERHARLLAQTEKITCRKSGNTWLVDKASCEEYFNKKKTNQKQLLN